MTDTQELQTRILIGASSFADAAAALKILRQLQPHAQFLFGGLFVEETATIALCQIPNQRIVSSGGALMIAPNASQVRTVLDADARAFRASLEQISQSMAGPCRFERSIGDLVQTALQVSDGWDIIVFGHRAIHPVGGKIVLLEATGHQNQTLSSFADHLAQTASAERVDFAVGPAPPAPHTGRVFETLQDALTAVARTNVEGVLVDLAQGPVQGITDLRRLLDHARCPVFAFGVAYSGTELAHSTQIPTAPDPKA